MTVLRIILVLVAAIVVGLWLTPMRWAVDFLPLEQHGVRIDSASGSVWNGKLSNVSMRGVEFGDVALQLGPLSLLSGSPAVRFSSDAGLAGAAAQAGAGVRLTELKGRMALSRLQADAPPGSELVFGDVSLELDGSGCRAASGSVLVEGLDERVRAAGGPPGPYAGALRCAEGELIVDVSSANGAQGPSISLGRPAAASVSRP